MVTLNREDLQAAFRLVSLVPETEGIASSQMVRLKVSKNILRLNLTGSLFAGAVVKLKGNSDDWTFYFDRKRFAKFLGSVTGKEVALTWDGKNSALALKCGRANLSVVNKEKPSGYHSKLLFEEGNGPVRLAPEWLDTIAFL